MFRRGGRRSRLARVSSHACVDQDVLVVAGFDEVARQEHFHRATLRKRKSGRRELHEIRFPERGGMHLSRGILFCLVGVAGNAGRTGRFLPEAESYSEFRDERQLSSRP